jgi:hypothetical protein
MTEHLAGQPYPRRWHPWILSLLFLAVALRIGYAFVAIPPVPALMNQDGIEYLSYARTLATGRGDDYPSLYNLIRSPLYPVFLIPFEMAIPSEGRSIQVTDWLGIEPVQIRAIQITQAFLAAITAWLLGELARRSAGAWAGLLTLAGFAFLPMSIALSGVLMTETLFVLLTWWGVLQLMRSGEANIRRPMLATVGTGTILAAACLSRPTLLAFLPFFAIWLGIRVGKHSGIPDAFLRMTVLTIAVSVLLVPIMYRNLVRHGEFNLAPRYAAVMVAQSNSEAYERTYHATTREEWKAAYEGVMAPGMHGSGQGPREWLESARRFRREEPARWWRLQGYKTLHFWRPWLNPLLVERNAFLVSIIVGVPLFLFGALGLFGRAVSHPTHSLLVGITLIGYLTGGLLFTASARFRFPFVDICALLFAAAWIGRRISTRFPAEAMDAPSSVRPSSPA